MRKNNVNLTIIGILLISLGIVSNNLSGILLTNENIYNDNETNLMIAGYWIVSPIIIDGNSGWETANSTYDWITGSGSWIDPYIIENVTIDGLWSGSCIEIKNSNVYFIIRNCTVYHSGTNYEDAGIKLVDTNNGRLINNTSTNNYDQGIYLLDSNNNTIKKNRVEYNEDSGIYINGGINNKIFENNASDNYSGIRLHYNNYSTVYENILNSNNVGINSYKSNNNTIFENFAFDNSGSGIHLLVGEHNNISNNELIDNNFGILGSEIKNYLIFENIISTNNFGIDIHESFFSIIYNNSFLNNGANGNDDGFINQWDNGVIGNYWSDYIGVDADDDGFGDTPYEISGTAGSQDNYPLWDDSFNGNPIFIDGQASGVGAYNWTWAKSRIWCSGSGIYEDPYIIDNISINGGWSGSCIEIQNSDVYFIIKNCTFYYSGTDAGDWDCGIRLLGVNNCQLINNTVSSNWMGILLLMSHDNTVLNNIIKDSDQSGIYIFNSYNNTISGNKVIDNGVAGIMTGGSIGENNTINNNTVNNNYNGIAIESKNNDVFNNTINSNTNAGLYLTNDDNNITDNIVESNVYGIRADNAENNLVWKNIIRENQHGIYLYGSMRNDIVENNITDNTNTGVSFDSSNDNDIYKNKFIRNGINGVDDGIINQWDNGTIGNYWDDYNGKDVDDDGIGDTPYIIMGSASSQDNYPIWWDPLLISINSPQMDDISELSPNFNISIDEGISDTMWYSLDDGLTNITFTGLTGNIDQTEWNKRVDGLVTIKFFANDSRGYIGFNEVTVFKETIPKITINTPTLNDVFGFNPPEFSINIDDLSPINTTWYTIDDGLTNYTFSELNDFINQTAWDQKEDGVITIKFYANDSLGNLGFKVLNVIKDTALPIITIISPNDNELFGATAPSFNVEIYDANLDSMWYTLDNGLTNTTFTANGTIYQSVWDTIPDGTVSIIFYAKDSTGNIGFQEVTVVKEISQPSLPEIPGYNILLLLGIVSTITVIIVKKRLNHLN